jgi:hypothetical protein
MLEQDEELEEQLKEPGLGIGSTEFLEELDARYQESMGTRKAEDVAFRRSRSSVSPEQAFAEACRYFQLSKDDLSRQRKKDEIKPVVAWLLTTGAGLSQREAAPWLGASTGAAISQQLTKLNRKKTGEQLKAIRHFRSTFNF